jgi:ABC-type nitrate/sulfonate/bicarbonate transport system ATPase subunit
MIDRSYHLAERLLNIQNLGVKYGEKVILRDVNLEVYNIVRPGMEQGQVVALVGASGIGKTQLFRCIAGLQRPSNGSVVADNGNNDPVKAGDVGVVFQNYPLLKHRSVLSNLKLAAKKGKQLEKIDFYLKRFGLDDRKDLYPAQLSGGQRQRAAIIQQLLCSDHFLLMDEPFSGLDIKMKDEVCKLIIEVSTVHEKNTIILTTHDIDTAVRIADHVWVLGYQRDENGNHIPGATCIKSIDLIERGLAWNPDVMNHSLFMPTVREIESILLST